MHDEQRRRRSRTRARRNKRRASMGDPKPDPCDSRRPCARRTAQGNPCDSRRPRARRTALGGDGGAGRIGRRSSDNPTAAVADVAATFLRGFITTATERAPTRGRPNIYLGPGVSSRQTRRLNSLNSLGKKPACCAALAMQESLGLWHASCGWCFSQVRLPPPAALGALRVDLLGG